MTIGCYRYAGLRITSELDLPEWKLFRCDGFAADPDVRILRSREAVGTEAVMVQPDDFRLSIPDVCAYQVRWGREIRFSPAELADPLAVRLFLLGTAWGVLCYQRGLLALHATVVQSGTHTVMFCGPSGSGKSTLAATLIDRGYRLIGDDLCCFETTGTPGVYRGAPRLKLWDDALHALQWNDAAKERDLHRCDKYHLELDAAQLAQGEELTPLSEIYVLKWGDFRLERLSGLASLQHLVSAGTYRPELLEPMGQLAAHWERCARLARQVPVWLFVRPKDRSATEMAGRLPLR